MFTEPFSLKIQVSYNNHSYLQLSMLNLVKWFKKKERKKERKTSGSTRIHGHAQDFFFCPLERSYFQAFSVKLCGWYKLTSKVLENYFPLFFISFFETQSLYKEQMTNECSRVQITYSFTVYKQIYKYKYVPALFHLLLFHFQKSTKPCRCNQKKWVRNRAFRGC